MPTTRQGRPVTEPDRSNWTVEILGDFLEQKQVANDELIKYRYEADRQALTAQLDAVHRRIENQEAFRTSFVEAQARAVTRQEFEAQIVGMRERLEESLAPINKTIAEQGKPNWMLLIGMTTVVLGVLSGCWLLIGLQINVATAPQVLAMEQLKSARAADQAIQAVAEGRLRQLESQATSGVAADAESRTDRGRLNARVSTLETSIAQAEASRREAEAHFNTALTEIETQFCASDTVRNLIHAQDMRTASMLWAASHNGERLPTDNAFYPVVCNRGAPPFAHPADAH
jgi:hypothetical protein